MKTGKILVVSSCPASETVLSEVGKEGYEVVNCVPKSNKELLALVNEYQPTLIILFNISTPEENSISILLKESLPALPVVSNSSKTMEGKSVHRLGAIHVTDIASSDVLMLTKLRVYLRLEKIKELSTKLLNFN